MIKKKTGALLGCLLMLGLSIPLATAHLTAPSVSSEAFTGDSYRFNGDTPTFHSGVSGTYYGSAGAYFDSPALGAASSFASALCDLEVLGDGSAPSPLDESDVDGNPGGAVPDGTFDDGGLGGACHTNNHYSNSAYDTPGCAGTAYAKDAVSGGDVWIGATCDWKTTGSSPGFTTCVITELLSSPTVPGLSTCVANLVSGTTSAGPFIACGNDGVADSIGYNRGSNGANFINGAASDGCDPDLDSAAAVFVFEYAEEATSTVVPAVGGWIDNPDGLTGGGNDAEKEPLDCFSRLTVPAAGGGAFPMILCNGKVCPVAGPVAIGGGLNVWTITCTFHDACEDKPAGTDATLVSHVVGDEVDVELRCGDTGVISSTNVKGTTPVAAAPPSNPPVMNNGPINNKTSGDYICVMKYTVLIPAPVDYVGESHCYDVIII